VKLSTNKLHLLVQS